jgi:acyl carrier protein
MWFNEMVADELDFKELQEIIAEVLRVKPERIQMDVSLAKDLGADSLDLVELFGIIEDRYHVKILDELAGMKNTGDLWKFLQEHHAKQAAEK